MHSPISLSRRLILLLIVASGTIALLLSALQLHSDYRHEVKELESGIRLVADSHLKSIRSALYRGDLAVVREHLEGIVAAPVVEQVRLYRGEKDIVALGDRRIQERVEVTFHLANENASESGVILSVGSGLDAIYRHLFDSALVIVIGNTLKTLLVVALFTYLFNRIIGRHLKAISRYTRHLEVDGTPPLTLEKRYRNDELDELVDAVNRMRRNMESAYHQVSSAEAQSRLILSNTSDGIFGIDRHGKTRFINATALTILGYSESELLGQDNHYRLHHSYPDGSHHPESECAIQKALNDGIGCHVDNDLFWHRDGRPIPVAYSIAPIDDDEDGVAAVVTFRDTTHDQQMENLLYTIAKGVSAEHGSEFYDSLVKYLSQSLDADFACIGTLDQGREEVQVIAAYADGKPTEPFSYPLADTPCREIIEKRQLLHFTEVIRHFPENSRITSRGVDSYAAAPLCDSSGNVIGILTIMNRHRFLNTVKVQTLLDIFSARAAAELQRQRDEENLRLAASTFETREAICITDPQGEILRVNNGFCQITGYHASEVVGRHIRMMKSGQHDSAFYRELWSAISRDGNWEGEIFNRKKDGNIIPLWQKISAVKGKNGETTHYVTTFNDISDRKLAEQRIHDLAYYDALTGLPNRRLFLDRIAQAHGHAQKHGKCGALLLLDIDDFKNINDSLGHPIGDKLLITVAERLNRFIGKGDSISRLSGDEYAILLPEMGGDINQTARQALGTAENLRHVMAEPITIDGHSLFISQCIGITLFPYDSQDAESILIEADTAINKAKKGGRNTINIFQPTMQQAIERRLHLQSDIHHALQREEFTILYQPQSDGRGITVSAEALVRWEHPEHGRISPAEFIPVAEETGQIIELGYWILQEGCRQLKEWEATAIYPHLRHVAINVSPHQFRQPDFVSQVIHIVKESGIDPYKLELEITEGVLIDDAEQTIEKMTTLKRMGIRFAIDDFGTGYSSMSYLKQLPVNKIKIDQSFIRNVTSNRRDAAIVESIITIARSLGYELIAEGIETEEAFEFLRDRGCECYQGYLIGRPLESEVFAQQLLDDHTEKGVDEPVGLQEAPLLSVGTSG